MPKEKKWTWGSWVTTAIALILAVLLAGPILILPGGKSEGVGRAISGIVTLVIGGPMAVGGFIVFVLGLMQAVRLMKLSKQAPLSPIATMATVFLLSGYFVILLAIVVQITIMQLHRLNG